MTDFTELQAWKTGLDLVNEVYLLTRKFPKEEIFGLTSQMRRASISIASNLAEGCGRFTYAEKSHRFIIARGECTETYAQVLIAIRLKFITPQAAKLVLDLLAREGKLLSGLVAACKRRIH